MNIFSSLLLIIVITCFTACNNIDNRQVSEIIAKTTRYTTNQNLDSIKLFGDSINKNPDLGLAIINATKDSSLIYEVVLTSMVVPNIAAEITLTDLLAMPLDSTSIARKRIKNIAYWYSAIGYEKNILLFKNAIDSCAATLTIKEQAKLYILSTSPSQLGNIIKCEPNNQEIIEAIKSQYSNPEDIDLFHNALK